MTPAAEGYTSDIPQSLWERLQTYGVIHQWCVAWVAATMLGVGITYSRGGWKAALVALLACGGLLLYLQHKTRQDDQWDELLANDRGHWYQYHYDTE